MDSHTPGVYGLADVLTLRHLERRAAVQRYRGVADPPLPSAQEGPSPSRVLQKLYVTVAHSSATAYGSANHGRVARQYLLASAMCGGVSGWCVCLASTVQTCDRSPAANSGHGVACTNRSSTHVQDPLAAAGAVVLDCRPPLLPVSMNVNGGDLSAIQSSTMAAEADAAPPEREQSFGVGGGDLLSLICPELGATPLVDPGTDLEDELSTPAVSPVAADQGVAPLSAQADVDIKLGRVFEDVGSLPAMVTLVCDFEGGLVVTLAEYPVPATPGVWVVVAQPLILTSPAGPTVVTPGCPQPSTGSVSCSSVPPTIPVVSTPEESLSFRAAVMDQHQPWSGSSFGGDSAGRP